VYLYLLCFVLFVLFYVLFRLCIFILICFVCTSVRTLPPSDNSIAVNNNNNNNNNNNMTTEPNGKVTSAPLSACLGSETAERDFDEVGRTVGGREN
jgi:hypothetical protein